ncbi:MAG TPA: wax ester/triacylglycerol synthase domain-containing protein [Burkholderiaceae bacterium]|nr:wax ester/triacylglycerol synthase domain-containing protein [Burkholderiaceae bacterium]
MKKMPNTTASVDAGLIEELRHWGGPPEMSAFESVMWNAEVDPRLRSTTTSVLILDRTPDWDRFLSEHRWLVDAVPRFRQRVVVPAFGVAQPTWVDDPDFDLDFHVRRFRVAAPGSERQWLDAVAILAMTPFDRARPPWEATLVEGLEGGRAAYVLKLHHAVSDGLGIIQLLSRLFTPDRQLAERPKPPAREARNRRRQTPLTLGARAVTRQMTSWPATAATAATSLASQTFTLATRPHTALNAWRYLASARRMLAIKPVRGSGLFRRRSLSWRLDTIEVPLAQLRAASKAVEASVNDVFLSGLIGGFRRYHEEMGVEVREMPIGFPISLRIEGDAMGGNKFAGSQYAAPLAEKDPVQRIRHIQKFVRTTRAEPALDVMLRLMPLVSRLPLSLVTKLTADFTTAQDAQISNIRGIAHPVYFAGAEVTHFWPFAPAPGCALMIAMISHSGRCCIGINSDRAAVTEPELLIECLREGLDEVLALAQPAPKARTSRRGHRPVKLTKAGKPQRTQRTQR